MVRTRSGGDKKLQGTKRDPKKERKGESVWYERWAKSEIQKKVKNSRFLRWGKRKEE